MKSFATVALLASALAHETPSYVDRRRAGWKLLGRAEKTTTKSFTVGMPMKDFGLLERELEAVSDPRSPRYGQWLTKEQADAITATPANIAREVREWATSTGAKCVRQPEAFRCEATVDQIERLLDTELSVYGHSKTGIKIIRTSAPASVPVRLTGKVTLVTGLGQFPVPRLGSHRPIEIVRQLSDVDYSVVPQTLINFYNISFDGNANSTQAPIEFQGYPGYVNSDLQAFLKDVSAPAYTIPKDHMIGTYTPDPAAESTLDEQYIGAIGQQNTNWYWTESDWLFEFGNDLSSQPDASLPRVCSMSYAWYELDQCDISPSVAPCQGKSVLEGSVAFVQAVNQLFAKAGARGVTLAAASGDSGAHGRTDPGCTDPVTRPDYPSASPYVTSVGATEIEHGLTGKVNEPICNGQLTCATGGYEIVASNQVLAFFSSGGGFSNVAPRPSWQDTVVSTYLKNTSAIPPAADFNATGRGAPDVAALGHNYFIYMGGQITSVDGTSAATPVFSALVANLNAWRASQGKPVLGFVNPLLYQLYAQNKNTFNDVVQGDNTCTEDACPCPAGTGYYAAPGWDACTGLGTPNYGMIKATMQAMGI